MTTESSQTARPASADKTIWVFTPSRTDPKALEFILVQRHKLLKDAVERVQESAVTDHKHHLLFVGPRGCGKTHLVTLIVSRLSDDATIAERLRIAWLNEDETCTCLLDLLVKIHSALAKRHPGEYTEDMLRAAYELEPTSALDFVRKRLLASLGSRTLLVVAENLDAIFDGLGDSGQKQLRALIQENPRLSIVATAQRLVEDLSDRTSPFFGFFQTEHLKPLNVVEAIELLQNIARFHEKGDLVEFLSTGRGRSRVRALHHLSGGNHRIYIVLSQFITRDSFDALLEPFMKMVDELTPYYQERIRWLPPVQRKIVEYLCGCERTVPVKDIAKRLFATSQTISSQLQDLRQKGYVESSRRGRESLYEISEPLMRICVEVKDTQHRQPLRLLVDFLRVWYDDCELKERLEKMKPASSACAYLESAILKNSLEGNLRKHLFLEDFQLFLPEKVGLELREGVIRELATQPEGALLAMKSLAEGNIAEAIRCLDDAIAQESASSDRAKLLLDRAELHSRFGDREKSIDDYAAVIGLPGAPVEQVATAFVNRAITYLRGADRQRAIDEFTAAIGLSGVPVAPLAAALVLRAITYGQAAETQRAIDDYTRVIGLSGAPVKLVVEALSNRANAFSQIGETQREIDDYTALIDLSDAPVGQVAEALFNRGVTYGQTGERQCEIDDYTAVIGLPGAPVDQVAMALVNRAIRCGQAGDTQRAIDDYTAVIGLSGAPVDQVANALVNRAITYGQEGETQRAIDDYTTVIGLAEVPVEALAAALLYRAITYGQAGDRQRAIDDYTAVTGLHGAPTEHLAKALISRGVAYGEAGETQHAIDDYTAVVGISDAPVQMIAAGLFHRALALLREGREQESASDFEAFTRLPGADLVVHWYLAVSKLNFDEGKWTEGFRALEAGLECGEKAQPPYRGTATDLVGVIFSAGLSPEGRREKISDLLGLYNKHRAVPVLGEAVVQHIGSVFRAGEPFPSSDNLEGWASAWEEAAKGLNEFRLSLRLLRTGIAFLKAGGKDPGVLLDLTSTEREILQQALGISGKEQGKPK